MKFLENIKLVLGLGWRKEIKEQKGAIKIKKDECVYDTKTRKLICPRPRNKNLRYKK